MNAQASSYQMKEPRSPSQMPFQNSNYVHTNDYIDHVMDIDTL